MGDVEDGSPRRRRCRRQETKQNIDLWLEPFEARANLVTGYGALADDLAVELV